MQLVAVMLFVVSCRCPAHVDLADTKSDNAQGRHFVLKRGVDTKARIKEAFLETVFNIRSLRHQTR